MAGKVLAAYTRADTLISQVRDNKTSYYLYDGHGDVRALLNEDGRITDKYRYNAYGELVERSGETENHFLYTGEYYDGVSDLYYLRARYMSPSTGNFISMDTYEGSIYDPDCLHKYLYANGNPVTYSDLSGNMFDSISMTIQSGIQSILDNMVQIAYRGVICGLTNSIITALTGGSFSDACKSFLTGFLIGAGISPIRYFVVGAEIVSLARFYVLEATAEFIFSVTVAIFSISSGNDQMSVVSVVMVILSLFHLGNAYGNYLLIDVYGPKGAVSIEVDPIATETSTDTVTYRRVQGGVGNQSSQQRVIIDSEGNVSITKHNKNLNVSIDNGEHAQYYVINNRHGADIYEFDVPKWFDDMVNEYIVSQAGAKGGCNPKLTDVTTPGKCVEFPAPWVEWIEEYAINGRIIKGSGT